MKKDSTSSPETPVSPPRLPPELPARCFDRPGIAGAFLFGSAARGSRSPLSDLDFAYLGTDVEAEERVFDAVYESLQRELGEGEFDLVPLRRASLHLQYQIATDGELILCRDATALERFSARAICRYLDFKPYRDAYFSRSASQGG